MHLKKTTQLGKSNGLKIKEEKWELINVKRYACQFWVCCFLWRKPSKCQRNKRTKDNILVLFAKCPLSESYHSKMKMLLYHSSLITAFLWKLFKSQGCLQDQLLMKKIKASSVFIIVHLFRFFLLRSTSDGQMIRDCHHYHTWYLGEITVCGFCPFALLPFCPHALALAPVMVLLFIYGGYQEKTFFVFVFTFRFMCRYRRLSWCYSCLHRWLWPSSLETNKVFALFGCNCWSSI